MSTPIFVTRPSLPPLDDLIPLLRDIWDGRILTNSGPMHQDFERQLATALTVDNVSVVTNGTLALSLAIDAAALEGEVITTPYSFVATAHAAVMGRLEPVFVDIRAHDFNIDPAAIEAAITPRTTAIVGVHCYGNPCDVEAIDAIAQRNGLKVIYDAAHAFGVTFKGQSVLRWGDFSTLSFHATKVFNTFEGGAVVAKTSEGRMRVERLRNFGIVDEVTVDLVGGNAKMSEFNAALGLVQLGLVDEVRQARGEVDRRYRALLEGIPGIQCLAIPDEVEPNYGYFPILVGPEFPISRDALYEKLKAREIYSRRYFYPLLSSLPMYRALASAHAANLPVATKGAEQVLCLPIYPDLTADEQVRIAEVISSAGA